MLNILYLIIIYVILSPVYYQIVKSMAKITEKEIIGFYQDELIRLQKKIKKTEAVLEVLRESQALETAGSAKRGRKMAKAAKFIAKKSKTRSKNSTPAPARQSKAAPISAPASYDPEAKMDDKIAFALSQTGKAYKEDIIGYIQQKEPKADLQKLSKGVSVRLSALYTKGQIGATRHGRKYQYALAGS